MAVRLARLVRLVSVGVTSISFIDALPPSIERFSWSLRKPKTIGPEKFVMVVVVVVIIMAMTVMVMVVMVKPQRQESFLVQRSIDAPCHQYPTLHHPTAQPPHHITYLRFCSGHS